MSVLAFTWSGLAQQIVSGLSTGGIYASLALAIVIIYRSTRVINFAQGEMATFSTFIAWELINQGLNKWAAFLLTLLISFAGGFPDPLTFHGDADYGEALRTILLVEVDQPRHLDLARLAPGRPKIQQHGLAFEVGELGGFPIQSLELEIRRHRADGEFRGFLWLQSGLLVARDARPQEDHPGHSQDHDDQYDGVSLHRNLSEIARKNGTLFNHAAR